jgi:hypothetical protein
MECTEKNKKGGPCGSRSVRVFEGKALCTAHARTLGFLNDKEKVKENILEGIKKYHRNKAFTLEKLAPEIKKDFFLGISVELFNAKEEWPRVVELNPMPFLEDGDKKYLVGLWMMANPTTRMPATLAEVADIVGESYETAEAWLRSKEMLDIFDDRSERLMRSKRGLMDMILVNMCIEKNMKALEKYYELYVQPPPNPVGRPKEGEGFTRKRTITVSEIEKGADPKPRLKSVAGRVLANRLRSSIDGETKITGPNPHSGQGCEPVNVKPDGKRVADQGVLLDQFDGMIKDLQEGEDVE